MPKVWKDVQCEKKDPRLLSLQCQIIPNFLLGQLPERGLWSASLPPDLSGLELRCSRYSDYTNLDRLLRHLSLEAFLQSQKRRVDGIFQADIIIVPVS